MANALDNITFQNGAISNENAFQIDAFQASPTQHGDYQFKRAGKVSSSLFGSMDIGEYGYGDRGTQSSNSKFGEKDKAY